MRPADDIRHFINRAAVRTNPKADKAVLDAVLTAHEQTVGKTSATTKPSLRSIFMKSPTTKVAVAAAIVFAAVLFIGLWERSAPSAYAIEQTIEANRVVRSLHIRSFEPGQEEPCETWIELGEDGQLRKMRTSQPEWSDSIQGARIIVIWSDGTVQTWFMKQNRLIITRVESNELEQITALLREVDPRQALTRIAELKQQGQVEIAVEEPSDKTQPIVMTVTYLPSSGTPGQRRVLFIDPTTKLIRTMEVYRFDGGEYRCEARGEIQEYNEPIDPNMFDLTTEVPPNTERLDQ